MPNGIAFILPQQMYLAFIWCGNIINLANIIREDIDFKKMLPKLSFLRKYLNDSRYPYDEKIYTKDFFEECFETVNCIKTEVDFAFSKKLPFEKFVEKFGDGKVIDKRKDSNKGV